MSRAVPITQDQLPISAWSKIVQTNAALAELFDDDDAAGADVIGAAQELRSLVRQYV